MLLLKQMKKNILQCVKYPSLSDISEYEQFVCSNVYIFSARLSKNYATIVPLSLIETRKILKPSCCSKAEF